MPSITLQEFRQLVYKYRTRSALILSGFLLFIQMLMWFFAESAREQRHEMGLPVIETAFGQDYLWGGIIVGLFVVLGLCFYSFEKIITRLFFAEAEPPKVN